jgi:hypothetical protein
MPTALVFLLLRAQAPAQDEARDTPRSAPMSRTEQELLYWDLIARREAEQKLAERREAEYREHQFVEKVNRFAAVWNKLVGEYNRQRTFNVKTAKELSKAFRDLQGTGWPK